MCELVMLVAKNSRKRSEAHSRTAGQALAAGRGDRDKLVHGDWLLSVSAVDSHHPSPASQQVSSGSLGARRSDFKPTPRSRASAADSRRLISGSRAPLNSMNPAGRRTSEADWARAVDDLVNNAGIYQPAVERDPTLLSMLRRLGGRP